MQIKQIMSSKPITLPSSALLRELWKILFQKQINSIMITDSNNKLVGIATKEDLLKILYPDYAEYLADFSSLSDFEEMEQRVGSVMRKRVIDVMCKTVIFTRPDTQAMRALSRMIVRRVNQLPVVDEENHVVGMVTKGDIFYALFKREAKKTADAKSAKISKSKKLHKSK